MTSLQPCLKASLSFLKTFFSLILLGIFKIENPLAIEHNRIWSMTNSIGDPFEFDDMELSVNFYSVWHTRLQMLFQEFQFYSSIRRWIDKQSQPVSQIGSKLACWLAKSNCLAYSQLCSQSAGVSHSKKLICFDCVLNNNFPAQPKTCINSQNKVKQAGSSQQMNSHIFLTLSDLEMKN